MDIAVVVNGERHEVDVPMEMSLLWVIRDVIGLTGTKWLRYRLVRRLHRSIKSDVPAVVSARGRPRGLDRTASS